ncbi:MAG: DUF4395 family protein [Proteobacteria bacterium]|nr:DUF4395 family protein [Pseudomonadota bacterium]
MMTLSPITARRLQVQGFTSVDDAWLAEIAPWLRWSPALCASFAAIGTATASPGILLALAGTALLGAVLPFHPFDLIYNYGIRFAVHKRPLPPNGVPRRFACGMAAVWLTTTALLFQNGAANAGYALGILFVLVAALVSTTDICIPSLMFQFMRWLSGGKAITR